MNELNKRILQIADYYHVEKPADFAKRTGFSHQVASNYLKGTRIPNAEALCVIKQMFEISADWLLTGEGEMLRSATVDYAIKTEIVYKSDPRDAELISSKNEIIETQKELISTLKERIKEFESGFPHPRTDAFPSAHSAASTGRTSQSKKTK